MGTIGNKWIPISVTDERGVLGDRIDLWRSNRLWRVAESGYLTDGFETSFWIGPRF